MSSTAALHRGVKIQCRNISDMYLSMIFTCMFYTAKLTVEEIQLRKKKNDNCHFSAVKKSE